MSDIRVCPSCGQDRGGYYGPPVFDGWRCDTCHERTLNRARLAVEYYASELGAGEPADEDEATAHAIDLLADVLHYIDALNIRCPLDALDSARDHYEIERLGRYEENL